MARKSMGCRRRECGAVLAGKYDAGRRTAPAVLPQVPPGWPWRSSGGKGSESRWNGVGRYRTGEGRQGPQPGRECPQGLLALCQQERANERCHGVCGKHQGPGRRFRGMGVAQRRGKYIRAGEVSGVKGGCSRRRGARSTKGSKHFVQAQLSAAQQSGHGWKPQPQARGSGAAERGQCQHRQQDGRGRQFPAAGKVGA